MNEMIETASVESPSSTRAYDGQGLVLVVDDQPDVRRTVSAMLSRSGYDVEAVESGEDCLLALTRLLPDVIYLDMEMTGLGGLETLEKIRLKNPNVPVVMLTGDDTVDSIVSAMKLGAYDYVVKPSPRQKLVTVTKNAVERHQMSLRLTSLEREASGQGYPEIVGSSQAIKKVFRQMDRLAGTDITLLVHGESGTGKELVAQAIHTTSARRPGPFVALNCAAIPETLQESELFGHEKGAFTGASDARKGKFELADNGTLFLDEVGELSLTLQAKLLRTLQEGTFQRVGGSRELQSDFRLIAATHRDLAAEVREGRFREDLYFRIVVFELDLPPLRDRKEDIERLVDHFLALHAERHGSIVKIDSDSLEILRDYSWPGNVRELQNVIQRSLVFSDSGVIVPENLPPRITENEPVCLNFAGAAPDAKRLASKPEGASSSSHPPGSAVSDRDPEDIEELNLDALERRAIEKAMGRSGGNVTEVGRLLGISRATLYRKLKKYGLK
jgi:DNA-binding NtrC family response regulator